MAIRLRLVVLTVLAAVVLVPAAHAADPPVYAGPVPKATCGPGSLPETGLQGRVSAADSNSGRAARGYTCNTQLLGHSGTHAGFRVHRYVDPAGHECAYYDTTVLFPVDYLRGGKSGVDVLDMADPTHPVVTATLSTLAMLTPHESLSLNLKRGLLAADMGNPVTYPGVVDIYDLTQDCRHPVLKSSLPIGVLGHEGGFSPDGNTFYVTSIAGVLSALDISNPSLPIPLWTDFSYRPHGINVSDDGNRLYMADIANADEHAGLTILDVSQIQRRVPNPKVSLVAKLSWDTVSVPQTAIPVTINHHPYLVEIDEFARNAYVGYNPQAPVGAARIIDIADDTKPRVVSNIRLEVNMPANRAALGDDQGANSGLGGYTGHYCAVPQRAEPGIVACSFILSGLRVFDIRDPFHPKEIAYFNKPPPTGGSFAMSAPAFVPARGEIWYADGNSGFYAVKLTNGVWPFPAVQPVPKPTTAPAKALGQSGSQPPLPVTGRAAPLTAIAVAVGCALFSRQRRRR